MPPTGAAATLGGRPIRPEGRNKIGAMTFLLWRMPIRKEAAARRKMATPQDKHALLKRYWGYDSFRPLQEEIIDSLLQGHDTLALLPTGGGKSLCYQLPALMGEGLCLVVSPLIALMKDQVQQLRERGIKAACLVSGLTAYEQGLTLNNCIYGKVKLLYVSPERLRQRMFIEHLRQMKVSLIAVDEAHCVSQWGYDFRPPYLEIAAIRQYHPQAPMVALTATATPEVVRDIRLQLGFRQDARMFQSSFERENLSYMVIREEDKRGRLLRIARTVKGSGIVYVRNRRATREVSDFLTHQGVSSSYYHGGLSAQERDLRQRQWMDGATQVMVATNAFGMGIDKSDVRFVAHLDIPSSPEAYFQEAGRAGRDGRQAYAVILYEDADLARLDSDIERNFPPLQQIRNAYRAIGNYYAVPLGSGEDARYDFAIENICSTYGFNVADFYTAARFLEREGLIALPEREEVQSQMYVPVQRDELYRFQVEHARYGELLQMVLRLYGGLFTEYVPISERDIARRLYQDEATVANMLSHMDALKVISYKRKSSKPQIVFSSPRVDADNIYISDKYYKDLRAREMQRAAVMRQYVSDSVACRSNFLLDYFGERKDEPCGNCDCCRRRRTSQEAVPLRDQILELLKTERLRADQIADRLGNSEALQRELSRLTDEGKVLLDKDFQFFV